MKVIFGKVNCEDVILGPMADHRQRRGPAKGGGRLIINGRVAERLSGYARQGQRSVYLAKPNEYGVAIQNKNVLRLRFTK
jgi:hypothetical protein